MGGYDEESLEARSSLSSASQCSDTISISDGSAPLRHNKSVSPSDGRSLRPIAGNTLMEILAGGIAGASVATSVVAMILQPANIIFVAGGLSW